MSNKKKWNIVINIIISLLGLVLIKNENLILSQIAISLISGSIGSFITIFLSPENRKTKDNVLSKWKMTKIYKLRTEKNMESDQLLIKTKKNIDGVAFGLRTWRENNSDEILKALNRGVNIRLITMNPLSHHTKERANEEGKNENIEQSINDLITFAKEMNSKSEKGKIYLKGYDCMTLDFYWRMDNCLFVGPYLYKFSSGSTITYKFESGGKGFEYYKKYFEKLWNDNSLIDLLKGNN